MDIGVVLAVILWAIIGYAVGYSTAKTIYKGIHIGTIKIVEVEDTDTQNPYMFLDLDEDVYRLKDGTVVKTKVVRTEYISQ